MIHFIKNRFEIASIQIKFHNDHSAVYVNNKVTPFQLSQSHCNLNLGIATKVMLLFQIWFFIFVKGNIKRFVSNSTSNREISFIMRAFDF